MLFLLGKVAKTGRTGLAGCFLGFYDRAGYPNASDAATKVSFVYDRRKSSITL